MIVVIWFCLESIDFQKCVSVKCIGKITQNDETGKNGKGRKTKILWRSKDNLTEIISAYCFSGSNLALSFSVAKLTEKKGDWRWQVCIEVVG